MLVEAERRDTREHIYVVANVFLVTRKNDQYRAKRIFSILIDYHTRLKSYIKNVVSYNIQL
jgi:hypothetical protein